MRFNTEAYNKLFPRTAPTQNIETAVETFRPSEEGNNVENLEEGENDGGHGECADVNI